MPRKEELQWVGIDISALRSNYRQCHKLIRSHSLVMPVVKSNAYGHGLNLVAKALEKEKGVWGYGVAHLHEAFQLRDNHVRKNICVLSAWPRQRSVLQRAVREKIDLVLYTESQRAFLDRIGGRMGVRVRVHVDIDVGTSRVGVLPKDVSVFFKRLRQSNGLKIAGIMAHFADAESANQQWTYHQLNVFRSMVSAFGEGERPLLHTACTAAMIQVPLSTFDCVRLGIGLYGIWPSKETKENATNRHLNIKLKPVLSWHTQIIQVKRVPRNTYIGYGRTFKTRKSMTVGIVPIGYWDGYDRGLSNKGEMLVRGKRCPVRGRVCMNLTMIDVTNVQHVREGDDVVVLGKQRRDEISAEELAAHCGTIPYEIVARINPTLSRHPL